MTVIVIVTVAQSGLNHVSSTSLQCRLHQHPHKRLWHRVRLLAWRTWRARVCRPGLRRTRVPVVSLEMSAGRVMAVLQGNNEIAPDVCLLLVVSAILTVGAGVTEVVNVLHHGAKMQQRVWVFDEPCERGEIIDDSTHGDDDLIGTRQISYPCGLGNAVLSAWRAGPDYVEISPWEYILHVVPRCDISQDCRQVFRVHVERHDFSVWPQTFNRLRC